jgi:hypothetical protein
MSIFALNINTRPFNVRPFSVVTAPRFHCPFYTRRVRPFLFFFSLFSKQKSRYMGKKARMKIIRKIAETLPAMQTPVYGRKTVCGLEVINDGVTTIQGQPVDPLRSYSKKIVTGSIDVNHARRLKTVHKQLGIIGIKAYVQGINQSIERQLAAANANTQ